MAFEGGCHCGKVKFTVNAELPKKAMSCNCSICRAKGLLLDFCPVDKFTVSGEDALTTYLFYKHRIEHKFCKVCGVQPFATGKMPDGSEMRAINLRCVPAIDLDSLEIRTFDGASM